MSFIELTHITLKMIIDAGLLKPGANIYSTTPGNTIGNVNFDGSITIKIDQQGQIFGSPTSAARAIIKSNINGWVFWKIIENGEYKTLSYLREKYKEMCL